MKSAGIAAAALFAAVGTANAEPPKAPQLILEGVRNTYGVLRGNFTIVNPNDSPIKDVILNCEVAGASGTAIVDRRFIVYQIIPGQSRKSIKNFDLGLAPPQTDSFACRISLR